MLLGGSPTSVDWREQGAVTSVKTQGYCGGCWAFSAAGAMEGAYVIANKGPLTDFSMQQIIDCVTTFGNNGCSGGIMQDAFDYLRSSKLQTLASYPYIGKN